MGAKQFQAIYQVKVSLVGSKPPIWRRLLVHSNITLDVFHTAIQYSMGWLGYHLHQFEKDRIMYGIPDNEFGGEFGIDTEDETKYKLSDVLREKGDSLIYEYDFGDSWRHRIILEKLLPIETTSDMVRCVKGKRSCPPEDCGGVPGYENLLEIINDPSHAEHEEMLDWLGGEFDPEYFSLSETNSILSTNVKQNA